MARTETHDADECVVPLLEDATPAPSAFRQHMVEALNFCISAAPISVQCLNYCIFVAVIQMWVGHLSTTGLAAVALGVQLNRALGFFLVQYLTSAMETIAAQAIGAREYSIVGVTLQRALLMNVVFLLPLVVTAFHSERILLVFHQDPIIASSVQEFLVFSLPGTFCQVLSDVCIRYMSLNAYKWPIGVAQVMAISGGLFGGAKMVTTPGGAVRGAALSSLAYSACLLPMSAIGVVCLHRKNARESPETRIWHGLSMDAFRGWGHYLRVGGGAVLMFAPKQFFMEYLFILTGTLPEHTAASTAISLSMMWVVTSNGLAVGFNLAAMAGVGRATGSGDLGLAKVRVRTYWSVALTISITLAVTLLAFERGLSGLFSNDPDVLHILHQLKWTTSATILFSWMGMISLGILGGFRRHYWGACVAIPSFLVFGFGMAPVLIIWLGVGTLGASISYLSVMVCETGVLAILLSSVNYEREYARVAESIRQSLPLK